MEHLNTTNRIKALGAGLGFAITAFFAPSVAQATTTYTLTELDADSVLSTTALTVTTYVENADGTVSSVVSALTAVVNAAASETDGVTVSYYNWDSSSGTYVYAGVDATSGDITVYSATTTDVYQQKVTDNSTGTGNTATGGAAISSGSALTTSSDFVANQYLTGTNANSGGGAIRSTGGTKNITGSFVGNNTTVTGSSAGGGAIVLNAGTVTVTGDFIGNSATGTTGTGGAVRFGSNGAFVVTGNFIGNSATLTGGAILAAGTGSLTVNASSTDITDITGFIGNTAGTNGGAICFSNTADANNLNNVSFYSNTAGSYGGAICITAATTVNINASSKDVYFTGNTDSTGSNAIYLSNASAKVVFNASEGYSIVVNDAIGGSATGKITVSGAGTTVFNNEVASSAITVSDGATLALGSVVIDETAYSADLTSSSLDMYSGSTLSFVVANSGTNSIKLGSVSLGGDATTASDALASAVADINVTFTLDLTGVYGNFDLTITLADADDAAALYSFLGSDLDVIFGDITVDALSDGETYTYATIKEGETLAEFDIKYTEGYSYITISGFTTAVPEPSTYAMILGALAFGFAYYRRRK